MRNIHTSKGNSLIVIIVVFALLVGGGILYYKGAKIQKEAFEAPLPPKEIENTVPSAPDAIVEVGAEDEMLVVSGDSNSQEGNSGIMEAAPFKEFTVEAKNFEFSIKEIRVEKGDFVRVNLKSTNGFHDWVVDAFNAATKQVNTGDSSSVEFKADKTGTFEFYCSVGTHRQMGMVGKLIIE